VIRGGTRSVIRGGLHMNSLVNIKYELYRDYAHAKGRKVSNESYRNFVKKFIEKSKKIYGDSITEEKIIDYMKYSVLSTIAEHLVNRDDINADMSYSMNNFLKKYNIIEADYEQNVIDLPMYNRIKLVYDKLIEKKQLESIDEYIEKLPSSWRKKYYDIINPKEDKGYDMYDNLKEKKKIIDYIEELEQVKEPIKILVRLSESNVILPGVYRLQEMNDLCKKADEMVFNDKLEGSRHPKTYDKVEFLILADKREKAYIIMRDRIDIGEKKNTDFYSFIVENYGYEKMRELEKINNLQEKESVEL